MAREVKSLFSQPSTTGHSLFPKSEPNASVALFGEAKVRKRIEIQVSDLQKYSNDANVLNKAHGLIVRTNVEEICLKFVLDWGSPFQERHSAILGKMMQGAADPLVPEVKNKIGELIDLISSVEFKTGGFFFSEEKFKKKMNDKIASIKKISDELCGKIPRLFEFKDDAESNGKGLNALAADLEPYVVTCQFFSEYTRDGFPSELYVSRLLSLLSTQQACKDGKRGNEMFCNSIISLIDLVQNIVRNEIPLWYCNYINFLTGAGVSDISSLQDQTNDIVKKLKS